MADYPACMGAHEVLRRASKGKTLRVRGSDGRRRGKPSGFTAPTSVEGENPQGSQLRRASKEEDATGPCAAGSCRGARRR